MTVKLRVTECNDGLLLPVLSSLVLTAVPDPPDFGPQTHPGLIPFGMMDTPPPSSES
jgi:hypothetical protein